MYVSSRSEPGYPQGIIMKLSGNNAPQWCSEFFSRAMCRCLGAAMFCHGWLLVSWCFEPSQPQRITSGLKTNYLHVKSLHESLLHRSLFFFFLKPQLNFCPQFRNAHPEKLITCFGAYLYSLGTQHGNLHPARRPILLCGPTQEPVLATDSTRKTRERFGKKCRWMDRKGRN